MVWYLYIFHSFHRNGNDLEVAFRLFIGIANLCLCLEGESSPDVQFQVEQTDKWKPGKAILLVTYQEAVLTEKENDHPSIHHRVVYLFIWLLLSFEFSATLPKIHTSHLQSTA
jgi:hypothetical protein